MINNRKIYTFKSVDEQLARIDGMKIHPIHYALVKGIEKEKMLN